MLLGHTDGVTGTIQQQNESYPDGLSGFHYLCGTCEDAIIPRYFGLLKKRTVDRVNTDGRQANEELLHKMMSLMRNLFPHKPPRLSQTVTQNLQPQNRVEKGMCSFYRKGTCIHGTECKGCPKEHPRPYK